MREIDQLALMERRDGLQIYFTLWEYFFLSLIKLRVTTCYFYRYLIRWTWAKKNLDGWQYLWCTVSVRQNHKLFFQDLILLVLRVLALHFLANYLYALNYLWVFDLVSSTYYDYGKKNCLSFWNTWSRDHFLWIHLHYYCGAGNN